MTATAAEAAAKTPSAHLSEALLREFMHRRGFLATLKTFDEESPRDGQTISSRALMAQMMSWESKDKAPFMVQLCQYRLRKRTIRSGTTGAAAGERRDSSDDEADALSALERGRQALRQLESQAKTAEADALAAKNKVAALDAELAQIDAQLRDATAAAAAAREKEKKDKKAAKKEKEQRKEEPSTAPSSSASSGINLNMTIVPGGPTAAAALALSAAPKKNVFDPLGLRGGTAAGDASSLSSSSSSLLLPSGGSQPAVRGGAGWAPGMGASSHADASFDPLLQDAPSARRLALATQVNQAAAKRRHDQELAEHGFVNSPGPLDKRRLDDLGGSATGGEGAVLAPVTAVAASGAKRNRKEARAVAMLTAHAGNNTNDNE
jgi:hypothetical protein